MRLMQYFAILFYFVAAPIVALILDWFEYNDVKVIVFAAQGEASFSDLA
jgi:hypothetical protein